jgi:hypothetical protein
VVDRRCSSEAEDSIIGAALKEITGTRQLGTHGHRQDYHWKHALRRTMHADFLSQRIDDLTIHGAVDLKTCAALLRTDI